MRDLTSGPQPPRWPVLCFLCCLAFAVSIVSLTVANGVVSSIVLRPPDSAPVVPILDSEDRAVYDSPTLTRDA